MPSKRLLVLNSSYWPSRGRGRPPQQRGHLLGPQRPEGANGLEVLPENCQAVDAGNHGGRGQAHGVMEAFDRLDHFAGQNDSAAHRFHAQDADLVFHEQGQDLPAETAEMGIHHVQRHLHRIELVVLDTKDPQDEGCAEADLVRLGLHLWRLTGRREILAAAERCLINHFFFNQFATGDFGHRTVFKNGWRPSEQPGMAWWCCTMHGYRAFADVLQSIVTRDGEALRVNLYVEGSWSDAANSLRIERLPGASPEEPRTGSDSTLSMLDSDAQTLCLRQPDWARPLQIRLNGREMTVERKNGLVSLRRDLARGRRAHRHRAPHRPARECDGRTLRPEDVGDEPVEAALFYGPYLLAVHEADQPLFFRRPWMFPGKNASAVELPENWDQARVAEPRLEPPRGQVPLPGRVPARLPSRRLAEHESGGVPAVELVHDCPAAGGGRGVDSLPSRPGMAAAVLHHAAPPALDLHHPPGSHTWSASLFYCCLLPIVNRAREWRECARRLRRRLLRPRARGCSCRVRACGGAFHSIIGNPLLGRICWLRQRFERWNESQGGTLLALIE